MPPATEAFFREVVAAAWAAGRLQFLRLDVGGHCIAMLVNFLTPPGSFSFKTVFDEGYARFSPGVLIQLENLNILDDPRIALDGQLRGRGSSDDRQPLDRAPHRRAGLGAAEGLQAPRDLRPLHRPRTSLGTVKGRRSTNSHPGKAGPMNA